MWTTWLNRKLWWQLAVFVLAYNKFNTMYLNEGSGTLYDWVNDTPFGLFDNRKSILIARMNQLNLTPANESDRKLFGIF